MRFLFVARQERHAAAYIDVLTTLAGRGHSVAVAVQEAEGRAARAAERAGSSAVRITTCPAARIDEWAPAAALSRRLRDFVHFLRPPFRNSPALQERFFRRMRDELDLPASADAALAALRTSSLEQIERIEAVLALAERGLPTSSLFDDFLRSEAPDVVLVSPLIHLGTSQADLVASARYLGIPVWMLLFSWDNLSTKGSMHLMPDRLFVWNEQQRDEAERLHAVPPSRTVVVGAPRFDAFFDRRSALTRDQFLVPLGLDPQPATILYLCSSPLVSPNEFRFIRRWLAALRESSADRLRGANVVIRPHPANVLLPVEIPFTRHQWPAAAHIASRVARPVDDPRVVVLETPHEDPSGLYESLAHSDAVVALNTTAELEAGIVGRPVFTIRPDTTEDDGQQATLHFHYLTREHGGFVWAASGLAEHVQQLENALTAGADPAVIRSFIESFLRPHGLDRPVVPLLVDALESSARDSQAPRPVDLSSSPAFPHSVSGSHVVPLSYGDSTIRVRATPEALSRVTDHGAVRLDRATVKWLHRVVNERDVVYDVNAGFGPYTLIACHRGASVVAFEPAHAAYAALCENVALNGCHDAVVPIPLPLAGHDGLGDSRRRPLNRTDRKMQALCWSRLDTLVERYDLPPATHMRLSANVSAFDVLDGAERTVANAALRTIWLEIPMDREAEMAERLRASGLSIELRKERRKTVKLLFVRQKVVLDT